MKDYMLWCISRVWNWACKLWQESLYSDGQQFHQYQQNEHSLLTITSNHVCMYVITHTVKPVYKGHSREPENVAFMSSCSKYIQVKIIYTIH
jgi:hypothetical protein